MTQRPEVIAPPPTRSERAQRVWTEIAEQARNTTRWIEVEDVSAKTATLIRQGKIHPFGEGAWEVTTRNNTRQNRCTLYIRYVG